MLVEGYLYPSQITKPGPKKNMPGNKTSSRKQRAAKATGLHRQGDVSRISGLKKGPPEQQLRHR